MPEKLQELMNIDNFERRAELEQFFLRETVDALDSRNQKAALQVAAQFDRFKKDTDDEFYQNFFEMLGQLIKRKYLDRDEDFGATNLTEFLVIQVSTSQGVGLSPLCNGLILRK